MIIHFLDLAFGSFRDKNINEFGSERDRPRGREMFSQLEPWHE